MSGSTSPKKRHVHLDALPSCMTSVVAKGELVGEVPNRLAVPPNHVARQGFHADGEHAAFAKEERGVVEVQVIVTR
uniref:Uncharacterized protein n=1 Tax=Oryza sativa subsp. japonica TaxID=39947 RepID=Q6ZKR6_ORYSJ|nr:hypothetical protein [Oryza sativa Japonica Group]